MIHEKLLEPSRKKGGKAKKGKKQRLRVFDSWRVTSVLSDAGTKLCKNKFTGVNNPRDCMALRQRARALLLLLRAPVKRPAREREKGKKKCQNVVGGG